jgi:hypothetical protein
MKKWFRHTAAFLAAALAMSIPAYAAAEVSFDLSLSDEKVQVEDVVKVTVSVQDNPGIAGLILDIAYDDNDLNFLADEVKAGSAIADGSVQYVVNPDQNGDIRIAAMSALDFTKNGSLFTLSFEVLEPGYHEIELKLREVINAGQDDLDFTVTTDAVTVVCQGQAGVQPPAQEEQKVDKPLTVSFTDVPESHWAHSYIQNVVRKGLFTGISNTQFGPDLPVTRGMFVTVLYGHAGAPTVPAATFLDVPATTWYARSVSWASEQGIVSGIGDNKFGPELSITREQLALILYQYAKGTSPGTEAFVRMFYPDGKDVSSWALTAMSWAINEGLISGKTGNLLAPKATATRAEVAVIMQNFMNRNA